MINYILNEQVGYLHITPQGKLQVQDFEQLTQALDTYLKSHPKIKGLIIETPEFPGWENFNAVKAHFKFIKNHHKYVEKIAIVTNSKMGNIAEALIPFLMNIKVKRFSYGELQAAKEWISA